MSITILNAKHRRGGVPAADDLLELDPNTLYIVSARCSNCDEVRRTGPHLHGNILRNGYHLNCSRLPPCTCLSGAGVYLTVEVV